MQSLIDQGLDPLQVLIDRAHEHNMDFILRRDIDRIIVMDRGQILMEGTPREIRGSREVIEAYLGDTETKE